MVVTRYRRTGWRTYGRTAQFVGPHHCRRRVGNSWPRSVATTTRCMPASWQRPAN